MFSDSFKLDFSCIFSNPSHNTKASSINSTSKQKFTKTKPVNLLFLQNCHKILDPVYKFTLTCQ